MLAEEISGILGIPVSELPTDTEEFMRFFYMYLIGDIMSLQYTDDMLDRLQRVMQVIMNLERIMMEIDNG